MNDLLTQQEAIERAGKLQAVQATGLLPATYTRQDLADIEAYVTQINRVARFCRIDLAILQADKYQEQYRKGEITYAERTNFIQINNERLANLYGIKRGSLESEMSTMRQWGFHERVFGATVEHYRVIPASTPRDHARQLLMDAVEGEWTTTELYLACQGTMESVVVETPPSPQLGYEYTDMDWASAEQFCHYHEINHMRRETPNQVVFHSNGSGVLILESDTPIRFTVREQS